MTCPEGHDLLLLGYLKISRFTALPSVDAAQLVRRSLEIATMKNQYQFASLLICTILLLSLPLTIAGQVDCSLRTGGASGFSGVAWERACDEPPGDIFAPGTGITCYGCMPGTSQPVSYTHLTLPTNREV